MKEREVYINNSNGRRVGKGYPNCTRFIREDLVRWLITKYRAERYINRALRKKLQELEQKHHK